MKIGYEYLKAVINRFKEVKRLGDKTLEQLADKDMNWAYNIESNSIVVIVKHMSGNMLSRWTDFLTTDGEKEYRNREEEFMDEISTKAEVAMVWEKGWCVLMETLTSLKEEDLLKTVYIRGEGHLVLEAIERQLAHYAYHVGQMVYIGKQLKDKEWKSLSIPRGKSEGYLKHMHAKHKGRGMS